MQKHVLADKTVADVCEALIGAALLSHHETGNLDMAVKAVTAVVANKYHEMTTTRSTRSQTFRRARPLDRRST